MRIRRGWSDLGFSLENRAIRAFSNFDADPESPAPWTLVFGGTHGDELATVPFLEEFVVARLENGLAGPTAVIPVLNPDGYARGSRYNARGVDLNRNLPARWSSGADEPSGTEPLSEPEAKLLHDLLIAGRPGRIVSLHWALGEIDADGIHSVELARGMWGSLEVPQRRMFRLKTSGKPLPGSLGSFCAAERKGQPALVTLELPYHPEPESPRPEGHLDTVHALWREERSRYWNAVYPAVEAMLRFAIGA